MSKADDLLAELDAEFGKEAQKKAKAAAKVKTRGEQLRELNRTFHQRHSTGGFSDVAQDANLYSRNWSQVPGYRPLRRVTWLIDEYCDNCHGTISYVGNVFTEYFNRKLRAKVFTPEAVTHDENGKELPHELEQAYHTVPFCAACLRLSRRVEDHLNTALINGVPKQNHLQFQIVKE